MDGIKTTTKEHSMANVKVVVEKVLGVVMILRLCEDSRRRKSWDLEVAGELLGLGRVIDGLGYEEPSTRHLSCTNY